MFDTPIEMHTSTQTADVSLSQNFQDRLSDASRKHGILECGEQKKWSSKNKWKNREYHVPNNEDVSIKMLKFIVLQTNFFILSFCGPHKKPHSAQRLSQNYYMRFYIKLVHGTCEIHRISCVFI